MRSDIIPVHLKKTICVEWSKVKSLVWSYYFCEAFLPGFGAELKLVGLQYFHRFQSIAAQTKRQKFQLRCALYPRPEGRGFTARLVKNQLVSFLILDSSSAISLSKNSCAVIPFGTSGINPGPSRVFSIQRIALSAPVLHIST